MEILIKSPNTELLQQIVESLREGMRIEGYIQDCDLSERTIDVNEENSDLVIINIE